MSNPPIPGEPLWIDEPAALERLAERLASASVIGLDTEFIRERTYYPRPCLMQLASDELTACVDALRLDLAPLTPLLVDPAVTKVMHSARQDLEVIQQTSGHLPQPLFDSQVAVAFVGGDAQVSYAQLVEQRFGVRLDKSIARTDWSRRPLSAAQLAYAAEDVRYLPALYRMLGAELETLGRTAWLVEEMTRLLEPAAPAPAQAWRRIKGANKLGHSPGRAVLARLAAWREEQAMQRDRPRQWIAADRILLLLAQRLPPTPAALEALDEIPVKLRRRHGTEWLSIIGSTMPDADDALAPAAQRLDASQRRQLDELVRLLRRRSAELGVKPELLAPRRELESLVRGQRDAAVLAGWRRIAIGRELIEALAGCGKTAC